MRWVPSRLVPRDGSTALSLAALIFVFVLLGIVALTQISQRQTNQRLDKTVAALGETDVIACEFIQAEAKTRRTQSVNSLSGQLVADRRLSDTAGRLLHLFKVAEAKTPAANKAGLKLFETYIRASGDAASARAQTTVANVQAARLLAAKADVLSSRLRQCRSSGDG